jgi:pilus assembly protein CpaB
MIVKSSGPNAMDDVKGSLTRDAFIRGEPMRRDKLVKAGAGGFMSAILPSGLRAVAIKVDNAGDDYAGGFILPNDRVDVIKIYRDDEATKARGVEVLGAQTILTNVKVLAIGQAVQEENGKKVVVGGNATLELDPQQAEQVILAERAGNANLHLVLRSLVDSAGPAQTVGDQDASGSGLTIVRFGAPQTAAQ